MGFYDKCAGEVIESYKMLNDAERIVKVAMPVAKDAKLIARALEKVHKSLFLLISLILKYEHMRKRIRLYKNKDKNVGVFYDKCALRYGMDIEDRKMLKEIMFLSLKHKESGFEFSKDNRVVIFDDNYKIHVISEKGIMGFIGVVRRLNLNVKNGVLRAKN